MQSRIMGNGECGEGARQVTRGLSTELTNFYVVCQRSVQSTEISLSRRPDVVVQSTEL